MCVYILGIPSAPLSLSLSFSLSPPPLLPTSHLRGSRSLSLAFSLSLSLSLSLALAFSLSSLPPIIQVQLLHWVVGVVNAWRGEYV